MNIIHIQWEEVEWVADGKSQIKKGILSFIAKSWRSFYFYRLGPMAGDNVLIPLQSTLVTIIIEEYEIHIMRFIA